MKNLMQKCGTQQKFCCEPDVWSSYIVTIFHIDVEELEYYEVEEEECNCEHFVTEFIEI